MPSLSPSPDDTKARDAKRRTRARRRWVTRGAVLGVLAAIVFVLFLLARPRPVSVEVSAVRRGPMEVTIVETGRTRVRERYVVVAPIAGELTRTQLHAGDKVQRGSVLARIVPQAPPLLDPRSQKEASSRLLALQAAALQAQASVTRSELAFDHARADAERMKGLLASGAVNADDAAHTEFEANLKRQEVLSARFAAQTAGHEVAVARAVLARYADAAGGSNAFDVAAPVGGTILRVVHPGSGLVAASSPLLELGDLSELEIVVDVLTEDATRISKGAKATLQRWGGPSPLLARVRTVEPSASTRVSSLGVEEQRVSVLLDLETPLAERADLGDGFHVEAHILTWQGSAVLTVPLGATFRQADGWAVFVVSSGRALRRRIELGHRNANDAEVLSGLSERESVVLYPRDSVVDGVRVAPE